MQLGYTFQLFIPALNLKRLEGGGLQENTILNLQIVANKSLMIKRRMKSETGDLKGVLAKNERGYILTAQTKRF